MLFYCAMKLNWVWFEKHEHGNIVWEGMSTQIFIL